MNVIQQLEKEQQKEKVPALRAGDTVKVHAKVVEGTRERIQVFEGTVISVGRGTPMPFQVLGNPELKGMAFQFMPVSIRGVSTHPPDENKVCFGIDLRSVAVQRKLDLSYLLEFYKVYPHKEKFFIGSFDRLAGTSVLKQQIQAGLTEDQIRATWQPELDEYKTMSKKYLLYP